MAHRERLIWRGFNETTTQATARRLGKLLQSPWLSSVRTAARTGAPSVVPLGKHGLWHLGTACLVVDRRDPSHSPRPVVCVGVLQGFGSLTRQRDF